MISDEALTEYVKRDFGRILKLWKICFSEAKSMGIPSTSYIDDKLDAQKLYSLFHWWMDNRGHHVMNKIAENAIKHDAPKINNPNMDSWEEIWKAQDEERIEHSQKSKDSSIEENAIEKYTAMREEEIEKRDDEMIFHSLAKAFGNMSLKDMASLLDDEDDIPRKPIPRSKVGL